MKAVPKIELCAASKVTKKAPKTFRYESGNFKSVESKHATETFYGNLLLIESMDQLERFFQAAKTVAKEILEAPWFLGMMTLQF